MISRRNLTKWAFAAPLAAASSARESTAQIGSAPGHLPPPTETRDLAELHKAALAEGGQLLVYGGGDLPNGAAGMGPHSRSAFRA